VKRKHLYKPSVPSGHTSNLLWGMIVTVSAGCQGFSSDLVIARVRNISVHIPARFSAS
jgi:hypothetical protein